MARSSFADLLNELRIPDTVQQVLLDENYDTETFGLLALSLPELDSAIDSMGLDITPRIRSSLRVLWTRCQRQRLLQVLLIRPPFRHQVKALICLQVLEQVHPGMNPSLLSSARISFGNCVTTLSVSIQVNSWTQISCPPAVCWP